MLDYITINNLAFCLEFEWPILAMILLQVYELKELEVVGR